MFARMAWLCALASCAFVPSAYATAWDSIGGPNGGPIKGEPSIVAYGSGNVAVFARGEDDALWWSKSLDEAKTFGEWKSLGGGLASAPSCVSRISGTINCYVMGTEGGSIWELGYNGGKWSDWVPHGGGMSAGPAAMAKDNQDRIVVIAVSNGKLSSKAWWSTGWGTWIPSKHSVAADASFECDTSPHGVCTDDALFGSKCDQRRVCLIKSNDKVVAWESADGFEWFGELPQMSSTKYRPEVLLTTFNSGYFFIIDPKFRSPIMVPWKSGAGFTGSWGDLGGRFTSGVSCTGKANIVCAGRGDNGRVYVNHQIN